MIHVRPHFVAALPALFVVGLACANASAQGLTGEVIGAQNDPKASARVQFDGPQRYLAVTGRDGRFRFGQFASGRYTISVRHRDRTQTFFREIAPDNATITLRVDW